MKHSWLYHYISKLSQFVSTIISGLNRVTKLAPNKVEKKHEPHFWCLAAEHSKKVVKNPKFNRRYRVRIAKHDSAFKKGSKQSFADETFTKLQYSNPNIQLERREW